MRQLFSELRRRGVLKAGGIYLAGGWVLIQVLDVIQGHVGLPAWVPGLVIWLVVLAIPLVLFITWRYDVGIEGLRLTPPADAAGLTLRAVRKRDLALLALCAVLVSALAFHLAGVMRAQQEDLAGRVAPGPAAPERSIAVLPFRNLGGDEENYLGQGLAEDILHRLASLPGLQVASRTASFELDTANLEMAEIGRRLGARNVLEGSVRREGEQVRIVAQLIDADTGYHLWSSRYDRRIEDLFRIYDEISLAVTNELQLTLAPGTGLASAPPTEDMQAYDYYLQARSILQRASNALNVANAQRFFANAVASDPDFAEAWAGQCRAFLEWHAFEPGKEKFEAAEQSCRRALEIDPTLLAGRVALGDLYRTLGAYEASVTEYRRALDSEPDLAIAWRGLGQSLAALDQADEAEKALEKAVGADQDDLLSLHALGDFYFDRGDFHSAMPVYERMAQHPRAGPSAFNALGAARTMAGDLDGAAAAFRQVIALEPTGVAYANVGVIYYLSGRFEDSVVMLREALGLEPDNPFHWSNLADSLRASPGGEAESRHAYEQADRLAADLLAVNPRDPELLALLAHGRARLGDDPGATDFLRQALEEAPDDPYSHYYAALVHLEAGRKVQALESVRRALELNYPAAQLRSDPQFDALREDAAFARLLEGETRP